MVDQLNSFASKYTGGARSRFGREVASRRKSGVGTWKDLTDNVNSMAGN